ncbi:hypothetical protein ISG33_13265 [Glaciecola sp. MH2013]|uniref:hypothetical protein n=1 Tax=Glaciecola sp. MH2013 TaxID=2785524 RepID=UPI00189F6DDA|nr:hypothetical protein [Glaciecola sp. MH2013]MBF7074369.1 hypothetical protein [Glaciecola sp. MH2013]
MIEDVAVANIYIEIINDPTLTQQTFRGLFVCARLYLGYKANDHRYLFNTEVYNHFSFPASKIEEAENEGKIVVPFAGKESKDYFVLSCKSMLEPELNVVYKGALERLKQKDFSDEKIQDLKQSFNQHKFGKMLIEMYWLDMVTFAKHSAEYNKSWRD